MRYAVELESYNRELHEKIEAIPNEKRVEPDIQIVAPALEASKYVLPFKLAPPFNDSR